MATERRPATSARPASTVPGCLESERGSATSNQPSAASRRPSRLTTSRSTLPSSTAVAYSGSRRRVSSNPSRSARSSSSNPARMSGQAQHTLGDHIALDLRGAAADADGTRHQVEEELRLGRLTLEHARLTGGEQDPAGVPLPGVRVLQLEDGGQLARVASLQLRRQQAHGHDRDGEDLRLEAAEGVGVQIAVALRLLADGEQRGLHRAALVGESRHGGLQAALVVEQGDSHAPAAVERADQVLQGHLDIVEEHLREVALPVDLPDRPDGHAGRPQRDGEAADPRVLGRLAVGADEDETPVAELCVAGPDLLAVDQETSPDEFRARRQRGQVGAGAGLRETLRPELATFEY